MERDQMESTLSLKELENVVADLFASTSIDDSVVGRSHFSDVDIKAISDHLKEKGKVEWSLRPRTYAVLRIINQEEVMDTFVKEGLSDVSLPYSERTLPDYFSSTARANFLRFQFLVLTGQRIDLESGQGEHAYIKEESMTQLDHCFNLGSGGFGSVDKVRSRLSLNEFARKRLPRGKTFKKDKIAIATFERELQTLKRLSHRHLVKVVGSYTDPKCVGIIMAPVAECNLAEYLQSNPFPEERKAVLASFYGCLCSALAYLHENRIRHKDIKPGNILIHGDNVLFTDFGTALDWSEQGQSTTRNRPEAISVAYCAPEVAAWEARNSSSDIWSLGCVFFEMTTVLKGKTLPEMRSFFLNNGIGGSYVRTNATAAEMWSRELHALEGPYQEPLRWVSEMTKENPTHRPSALQLLDWINGKRRNRAFISSCCVSEADGAESLDEDSDGTEEDEQDSSSWELVSEQKETEQATQILLEQGYDVDDEDWDATQALPWAIRTANVAVVRLLLQRGGDLDLFLPSGLTPLQEALRTHDIATATMLLSLGASLTITDRSGLNALFWAMRWGNVDILSLLIRRGSFTDPRDLNKILDWTVIEGNAELLRLLLLRGADPNHRNSRGQTALQVAIKIGRDDVALQLLEKGADVAARDEFGQTPIHYAAEYARETLVPLLIRKGARVNARARDDSTPLHHAIKGGSIAILKILLEKGANVAAKCYGPAYGGYLPVLLAASLGHVEMVELLLERGANFRVATCDMDTVLLFAVKQGQEKVAEYLIRRGVSPHISRDGITGLHKAAMIGNEALACLLLDNGVDIEAIDEEHGMTPLHEAAKRGHEAVVRLFIDRGATIDKQCTTNGWTALHYAIEECQVAVARLLTEKGADIEAKAMNGWTPLAHATKENFSNLEKQPELLELLLENGADMKKLPVETIESTLRSAVYDGNAKIVKTILEFGPPLEAMRGYNCNQGQILMEEALTQGHKEVTILLFDKRAKTETLSKWRLAPALHWAAESDHLPLAHRACGPHFINDMRDGTTALQKAAERGNQRVLEFLLRAEGIQVNLKSEKDGKTALDYAAEQGHESVVKMLSRKGASGSSRRRKK